MNSQKLQTKSNKKNRARQPELSQPSESLSLIDDCADVNLVKDLPYQDQFSSGEVDECYNTMIFHEEKQKHPPRVD